MRHLKRLLQAAACAAAALALALGAASPASAAKYTMKFAHNSPPKPDLLYQACALLFRTHLQIYSRGEADVDIYPSSQLGNDTVAAKKVQLGSIEIQIVASNNISGFDRRYDVYTLPFLFGSFKGAAKVFDGPVGQKIAEDFRQKSGIRVLGNIATGFRNITNSKHPILKPADLGGLRIRIAKNPIMVATYEAMGGSTIGMNPTETFSALSTKTVDGQDGGSAWAWAQKFYEVQKFLSVTRHQLVAGSLIINDKYYAGLPKPIQAAIIRAAKETIGWANAYAEQEEEKIVKGFEAKGLKIDRPDLAPFREAVKPVYNKFAGQLGGMGLVQRIIDAQK
ncbi:MAG: hypothetical protein A3J27_02540 [Candidatus Tectomicrobia bacterium RIFCSPLOWO2_12_FULL_69_37]|nr:MAG: hypothetical protein A3I72_04920 [Candidatus Tectomicrobia bacterium RIFCSPLOWO2_02_FULL_70_19]OGL61035.1 MAG: hypothetical protein A3J27_02540 [Candidatus Tectomicrobia bacterium RIFCSPLOWO2_12_FULL_69_37]